MARHLQLAHQASIPQTAPPSAEVAVDLSPTGEANRASSCEHRGVSKDGRIVCARIVEGDNEITPNSCRDCPYKKVNCAHLRFSLRQTSASPLTVRYNGRVEIWDDEPPRLLFERAACTAKVMPLQHHRSCEGCTLAKPLQGKASRTRRQSRVTGTGKVVSFPSREALAPAG
jgi:hypothetical protein